MITVNVYEQYFAADCIANSIHRHAALVMLIATSENGTVRYEAAVTFFPHIDEDDYAVSYDAYYSDVLYEAPGRRSKKREGAMLETLRAHASAAAATLDGEFLWDEPLREARFG